MEDSGAILAHISSLKEMLDQVNEEIEANIQITREIESSIVKCDEIEADFATREAELIRTSAMLQFDTVGYVTVAADFRASVSTLEKELCYLKMKRDEMREIDKREDCAVRTLLSEKYSLENEIQLLDKKNNVLKNSVLAFVEEILEDLHSSNSDKQLFMFGYSWRLRITLPHMWAVANAQRVKKQSHNFIHAENMKIETETTTVRVSKRRLMGKSMGALLKEGRGRFYILRRCIIMLLCDHD
ncbi:hypothetical protein Fmac_022755 [Flemingia macrophylla]|uniref:Uncharacterized protein n=1 Tax=Flemingia macrophylla TaxID=520843 RepID=A0ABD1M185_9FABA